MGKKLTIIAVSVALVSLAASPALANNGRRSPEPATPSPRSGFFKKIDDLGEKFQNAFRHQERDGEHLASKSEEFKERVRNRVTEAKKEQIQNWWNRAEKRLTMIIGRMDKVAEKIDARMDTLEEDGADVSAQRTELAVAQVKIDDASQAVASASAQIDGILENNEPREAFRALHELQVGVMTKIREAHRALVGVLTSLRNVVTP